MKWPHFVETARCAKGLVSDRLDAWVDQAIDLGAHPALLPADTALDLAKRFRLVFVLIHVEHNQALVQRDLAALRHPLELDKLVRVLVDSELLVEGLRVLDVLLEGLHGTLQRDWRE